MDTSSPQPVQHSLFHARFGANFLDDHAGSIITDPSIALVELVANAWDAGADKVDIWWYDNNSSHIEVSDNGWGMSPYEFNRRWLELNYNRRVEQGSEVSFPPGNHGNNRRAFGRNGKGRHGMFCFSASYFIETTKYGQGQSDTYRVARSSGASDQPYTISVISSSDVDTAHHGTKIWTERAIPPLTSQAVVELLGSRFIADPTFRIFVNGNEVQLASLSSKIEEHFIEIEDYGIVKVSLIDTEIRSRTTQQLGVAWWVNKRLVGNAEWRRISGEPFTDGRSTEARRYTFVVEADMLQDEIKPDWSGFKPNSPVVKAVASPVEEYIANRLHQLLRDVQKERKQDVIEQHIDQIENLPKIAQWQIGQFIEQIQEKSPTIRPEYLADTVEVLAKLEQARSGYSLLRKLATLEIDELDMLHEILQKWSVNEAKVVLDELDKRIQLIKDLEQLVDSKTTDELHDLQPLFERGLWIFGPEYESIEFTSNRALASVVRDFFGDKETQVDNPRRRPDFVIIPDTSIGLYACDSHDEESEVDGIAKLLIVELKRGGFQITQKEMRQADDYIQRLQQSGKISTTTTIRAYVLGSTLNDYARTRSPIKSDNDRVEIFAITYSVILQRAHARIFRLADKLKSYHSDQYGDPDVDAVLKKTSSQSSLTV